MTRLFSRALPLAIVVGLCGALPAQDRPLAITNARLLTMESDSAPVENATVLLRNGTIVALGKDVEIPPGAETFDAQGGTVMPGLVSAYSRAGLEQKSRSQPAQFSSRRWRSRGSRGSSEKAKNSASTRVADSIYARDEIYADLLACGVTTLALRPKGPGFPGQGAVVDPHGKTRETLVRDGEAFVVIAPTTGTANKKLLVDSLEKARKLVEERNKPAEPEKKPAPDKAEKKDDPKKPEGDEAKKKEKGEKPAPEKKEEKGGGEKEKKGTEKAADGKDKAGDKKKPAKKKDPNTEVLADVLEGKRRAFLEIGSAAALTHFLDATKDTDLPERVLVSTSYSSTEGRLDEVVEVLNSLKAPILTDPSLTSPAYSRALVNPAARLHRAGFEVGFLLGDREDDIRQIFYKLIELVRHGLDRDAALAGVTRVPAVALGLEDSVGTLAVDRDADLILFDRDPLDPAAKMVAVWHKGRRVAAEDDQ